MTTPTLALHVTEDGTLKVLALAEALLGLKTAVGELKAMGGTGSALSQLQAELKGLRGDVQTATTEIKAALVEGMKGTFVAAQQAATQGMAALGHTFDSGMQKIANGIKEDKEKIAAIDTKYNAKLASDAKVAGEKVGNEMAAGLEKGAVKVRLASRVALSDSVSASLSVTGMGGLTEITAKLKEVQATSQAVAAAAEAEAGKLLSYRIKMMKGSQAIEQARTEAAAKEEASALSFRIKMMKGSYAIQEGRDEAAAKEEASALSFRIKMMKGSYAIQEGRDEAAAKEEAAALTARIKLMKGSLAIQEGLSEAAAKEEAAAFAFRIKMMKGSSIIEQTRAAAAAKVEADALSFRIKMMKGSLAIDEALDAASIKEAEAWDRYAFRTMTNLAKIRAELGAGREKVIRDEVEYQTALTRNAYSLPFSSITGATAGTTYNVPKPQADASARRQVQLATNQAGGMYSISEGSRTGEVVRLNSVTQALKQFTLTSNDAHSAVRGLASGFGAMWLTWGQILPLMAGAALSGAFVQTLRLGADVGNTFAQIHVLADESAESVGRLEGKMFDLARNGPIGPAEIAKAMKTLSLAGLDADKTYSAIKEVLNFAVAGDTSIEKAADVMTTVARAFNISAQGFSYIGDTIAVAAAESKSSVESMGEAFKTASVINQQYGVSLKDTAVALSLLANQGIQGQAAGTALRNMYADLAGRSKKVETALKELGVNALDPVTGKMREQAEVFKELMSALAKRTPIAQFKYIQDIFSERGGKEAMAILTAMRDTAVTTGQDVGNVYEALAQKIEEAAGFTVIAAAKMSLTPLNQMKSVAATLQASLLESFSALEPALYEVSARLKEIFNSDEFKRTVTSMMTLVGNLTVFVVEHGRAIANTILAYMALRGVITIISALSGAIAVWGTVTAAATTAVGLAARAAAVANPLLLIMSTVLTLVAAGWAMYQLNATGAKKAQEDLSGASAKALLEKLQEEETRLLRVAEARAKGISLMQLEAQIALEKARSEKTPEMLVAETGISGNETKIRKLEFSEFASTGAGETEMKRLLGERVRLQSDLNKATQAHGTTLLGIERTTQHIKDLEAETAAQEKARMEAAKSNPYGELGRPGKDPHKGKLPTDTDMQTLLAEFRTRESVYKNGYENEAHILDNAHKNKLIDEGSYAAQLIQLTEGYQNKVRKDVQETGEAQLAEYRERVAEARKIVKPENLAGALSTLKNKYITDSEQLTAVLDKMDADAKRRLTDGAQDAAGAVKKLSETNLEYWVKAEAGIKKEAALAEARHKMAGATDEVRARFEAGVKVSESYTAKLEEMRREYEEADKALASFNARFDDGQPMTDTALASYAQMSARLVAATEQLRLAAAEIEKLKGVAGDSAVAQVENKKVEDMRTQAKDLSKSLSSGIVDALFTGGKAGIQKLRDVIKNAFLSPIKVVLQTVIQQGTNMLVNAGYSMLGLGNAISGGAQMAQGGGIMGSMSSIGGMASIGSAASGIGSAFMAGYTGSAAAGSALVGSSAVTAGGFGVGAGATGLAEMATIGGGTAATAGAGGLMSGISSAFAAMGPVGWIALAAVALYAAFGGKGGGPKTEAGYAPSGLGMDQIDINNQDNKEYTRADQGAAKTVSEGISGSYTTLARQLDLKNTKLQVAVFYAMDNAENGDAQTQLQVASTNYNRSDRLGGVENVDRGEEALKAALAEETLRVVIAELLSSDLADKYKTSLQSLPEKASTSDLQGGIDDVLHVKQVDEAFRKMGPAFDNLRAQSVESTKALFEAAGGFEAFAAALVGYHDNYYTAAEKYKLVTDDVTKALADVNVAMPKSRLEYRAAVEGAAKDLSESGQATFSVLIKNAGAFASLYPAIEEVNNGLKTQEELLKGVDDARSNLNQAYDAEKTRLTDLKDKFTELGTSLGKFLSDLTTGSLAGLTPQQQYTANKSAYDQALTDLNSPDTKVRDAALDNWQSVSTSFLDSSREMFGASDRYYTDLASVTSGTTTAQSTALAQVTIAQQQLDALDLMVSGLLDVKQVFAGGLADVLTAIQALRGAAVDAGQNPGDLVGEIQGLYQYVLGRDADAGGLAYYASAIGQGSTLGDVSAALHNSPEGQAKDINNLFKSMLGREAEPGALSYYSAQMSQGSTLDAVFAAIRNSPEYAALHPTPLAVGMDRVPYDGFAATLHKNETVLSAPLGNAYRNGTLGGGNMTQVVERLERLERAIENSADRIAGASFAAACAGADRVVDGTGAHQGRRDWNAGVKEQAVNLK